MANKACRVFGSALSLVVLLGGCSGSGLKSPSSTGGAGGSGNGGSSDGGSPGGTAGASATGGYAKGGAGGSGGTNPAGGTTQSGGGSGLGGFRTGGLGGSILGTGGVAGIDGGTGGHTGTGASGGGTGGRGGTGGSGPGGSTGGGGVGGLGGSTGGSGLGGSGRGGSGPGGSGTGGLGTGGIGTGGSGTGGSSGVSLVALANAFCATARSCCAKSGLPTTLDDCEAKFQANLTTLALVKKGTVTIDDTRLAACIEGYKQIATTCIVNPVLAACEGVFVGTKAEGAACGAGGIPLVSGAGECNSGGGAMECVWTGNANDPTVTGVCRAPARGKNGEACAASCTRPQDFCTFDLMISPGDATAVCFEEDGLYCNFATSPSTCVPTVALGGSCAADRDSCISTAICDSGTLKCRARATLGQSCSITGGYACLNGLVCTSAGKCAEPAFAYDRTCSGIPDYPY